LLTSLVPIVCYTSHDLLGGNSIEQGYNTR